MTKQSSGEHRSRELGTAVLWLALTHAMTGAAVAGAAQSQSGEGSATSAPNADQQIVLITGSTDGLGRELALRLGTEGAHVIVHGRNRERGAAVVEEIALGPGSARFYAADFASLDQVRSLAAAIRRDYERIDVLVNNAGIWLRTADERVLSEDGHELTFAVNYLAGFLLTHELLDLLVASAPARIVNVSSGAQQPIDFDDVMLERDFSGGRAYAQSKLAQILFTFDLAAALDGTGVIVNALHPATLMDTPMVRGAGVPPRSTVDEGAEAVLHLVKADGIGSGGYFNGMTPARAHAQAYDQTARARLRALSRTLVGLD
jgi:NAD(P)-dependent dehydrogenase (short-subunit alcohol dehydrogenase family)